MIHLVSILFYVILFLGGLVASAATATSKPNFKGPLGPPKYSTLEIGHAVAMYAKRYRLDPALLRAVIKVESDFRQDAVSRRGAVGADAAHAVNGSGAQGRRHP